MFPFVFDQLVLEVAPATKSLVPTDVLQFFIVGVVRQFCSVELAFFGLIVEVRGESFLSLYFALGFLAIGALELDHDD